MKQGSEGFYRTKLILYENPGKCLNFSALVLFFRFLSQGPAIGSNVPKNGVYSTFWYKVFSVEMPETSFLEYKKLNVSYISPWLYFFEFRPD